MNVITFLVSGRGGAVIFMVTASPLQAPQCPSYGAHGGHAPTPRQGHTRAGLATQGRGGVRVFNMMLNPTLFRRLYYLSKYSSRFTFLSLPAQLHIARLLCFGTFPKRCPGCDDIVTCLGSGRGYVIIFAVTTPPLQAPQCPSYSARRGPAPRQGNT